MDMTLRTLLEQRAWEKSRLEYQEIKSISLDVARGLNYLHSKKPSPDIHHDVSSANVLLWIKNGAVKRAKISDMVQLVSCKRARQQIQSYTEHEPKVIILSHLY